MFAGRLHDHPARGKIGAGDESEQRVVTCFGRLDQMQAGVDQFGDVVGRDVGGHAYCDAGGAVGQQVGKGGRQNHRLGQCAVVIVPVIYGIFVQPFQKGLRHGGHTGFGVAAGRGIVAVDIAEIALSVDERIAHCEILRQSCHRIIDRGIPMGMVITHHVAADLGGFAEAPGRTQLQLAHGIQNPAVHRLETVARIGQCAMHDGRERVGQIALADGAAQRLRNGFGLRIGIIQHVTHRRCDTEAGIRRKSPNDPSGAKGACKEVGFFPLFP